MDKICEQWADQLFNEGYLDFHIKSNAMMFIEYLVTTRDLAVEVSCIDNVYTIRIDYQ